MLRELISISKMNSIFLFFEFLDSASSKDPKSTKGPYQRISDSVLTCALCFNRGSVLMNELFPELFCPTKTLIFFKSYGTCVI